MFFRGLFLTLLLLSFATAQPISLHPQNPHYFLFRGKAVALVTSGEHYGAVLNADFDYRRYLATLQADHLNYTRLFGGSYVEVPSQSFGILRNDLAPAPERYVAPWARSSSPGYAGVEINLTWRGGTLNILSACTSFSPKQPNVAL